MTKALFGLALVILAGCASTANVTTVPLKDQNPSQMETDRKRCEEWAKKTSAFLAGFAACMIAAGYEAEPHVGSTSQTVRLAKAATENEPTRALLDILDCDAQARREAENDLGWITIWIRENLNWHWKVNAEKRRQFFNGCLPPRGYELGKA
jgi:hypothetical protein